MAFARRFTLTHNEKTDLWELRNEQTERVYRTFGSKEAATRRGVLEGVLGKEGGSVIIRKKGGIFEEQRTYRGR